MKKFLIVTGIILILALGINYVLFSTNFFIDLHPNTPVTTSFITDEENIYILKNRVGKEGASVRLSWNKPVFQLKDIAKTEKEPWA